MQPTVATTTMGSMNWLFVIRVCPITLLAERRSAPCCAVDSREVSSRQQGAEWQSAGKVSAVRMFYLRITPTKIALIHSISERNINICPYFPPTLLLPSSYKSAAFPPLYYYLSRLILPACKFLYTGLLWNSLENSDVSLLVGDR